MLYLNIKILRIRDHQDATNKEVERVRNTESVHQRPYNYHLDYYSQVSVFHFQLHFHKLKVKVSFTGP